METDNGVPEGGATVAEAGLALALDLLDKGGPAIWAILGLSILGLALILWKFWCLVETGAWRRAEAEAAVDLWLKGQRAEARRRAASGRGTCTEMVGAAFDALEDPALSREAAAAEVTRVAKRQLGEAQSGLRGMELIATLAPLLGLFGTVLGMIAAFQGLETDGANADAAALAGGIWEALLTTAAGMAVAIPVAAALTYFEGVIDRLRRDMEDLAGRLLNRPVERVVERAAE